ncbi:hypothetical protein MCOR27_006597 [Pyricularia oryzae]|nr:hypothetical protein MCOR27_006597 [Pyricularia oryzae]KAI6399153.1 hypothetical protein MCOR23_005410 [Pyricularia oryzae]
MRCVNSIPLTRSMQKGVYNVYHLYPLKMKISAILTVFTLASAAAAAAVDLSTNSQEGPVIAARDPSSGSSHGPQIQRRYNTNRARCYNACVADLTPEFPDDEDEVKRICREKCEKAFP